MRIWILLQFTLKLGKMGVARSLHLDNDTKTAVKSLDVTVQLGIPNSLLKKQICLLAGLG